MSKYLTTVNDEAEARVVLGRLKDAGIRAYRQGIVRLPQRDVYIERRGPGSSAYLLKADEGISQDELIRAEQQDAAARSLSQPPPAKT